jgi:hypothetical protein
MSGTQQTPFRVSLHEEAGDKSVLHFDCMANDQDHAETLAEAEYPGCEIRLTIPLDPTEVDEDTIHKSATSASSPKP